MGNPRKLHLSANPTGICPSHNNNNSARRTSKNCGFGLVGFEEPWYCCGAISLYQAHLRLLDCWAVRMANVQRSRFSVRQSTLKLRSYLRHTNELPQSVRRRCGRFNTTTTHLPMSWGRVYIAGDCSVDLRDSWIVQRLLER